MFEPCLPLQHRRTRGCYHVATEGAVIRLIPESLVHYLSAWNERDTQRIRAHLHRSVADDVLFVDPAHTTTNVDELEAMIREARETLPEEEYRLASAIDGHNNRYRYRWEVHRPGEPPIPGMDVTTVNAAGLIERIDGFFGDFAPQ